MSILIQRCLRAANFKGLKMTNKSKVKLEAIKFASGENPAQQVLSKAKKQLGFIPNMYENMANSPELLETYLDGYNRFRQNSDFTAVEQEVVFLTLSRENGCHYCMAALYPRLYKYSSHDKSKLGSLAKRPRRQRC